MRERHQRRADARLDQQEEREQCNCSGQQAERLRRPPAVLVAVDDRVHGQHQRGRHGHRTGDVELPGARLALAARQQPERQEHDGDADRQVDEEDPVPVERVGQYAAEQHADGAAARGDEAEDAHRLRPVGRLGEEVHHQRQRDGGGDCTAHALNRARGDEELLRRGEAAGERGEREQRDARRGTAGDARRGRRAGRPGAGSRRTSAGRRSRPRPARSREKPRSSRIDGSATFTIVVSRTIIKLPRQRTTSAYQRVRLSNVMEHPLESNGSEGRPALLGELIGRR